MVCDKCEKKLAKLVVQDKWKDGARNTMESGGKKVSDGAGSARTVIACGPRLLLLIQCHKPPAVHGLPLRLPVQVNENKALSKKKQWAPYNSKCTACKTSIAKDYKYCQGCSYQKGLCAM
jgi:hypothetical protein